MPQPQTYNANGTPQFSGPAAGGANPQALADAYSSGNGTPPYTGSAPVLYPRSSGGSTAPLNPAPIPGAPGQSGNQSPNLPVAPTEPGSAGSYTNAAETSPGTQAQLDAIRASFADQLNSETNDAAENSAAANYDAISRGMFGSPQADTERASAEKTNNQNRQTILDNQTAAITQVLQNADSMAQTQEQLDQSKYNTDYTNYTAQTTALKTQAQSDFATLAGTSTGTWADFVKLAPDSAQKIIDQTGYDPNMIPFLWNSMQTKANQVDYSQIAPIQNPDGTETIVGVNPNVPASDPNHLIKTIIDSAPQGFKTTIVGGLPYWQATDGSGALYPVPSDKGQFITLKDANGNNYLYNTYTKQYLNPLGADTSGTGQVSPNAPASPLTPTDTLSSVLGYYVNGNSATPPGAGYIGAVLNALGVSDASQLTVTDLQQKIAQLAAGIIAAENSSALSKVNNGGAIEWATAQAYGLDQMFGDTPIQMKGSDGQTHTYASFPDSSSGQQALQSYLTSVLSAGQPSAPSAQAQSYAADITNSTLPAFPEFQKVTATR